MAKKQRVFKTQKEAEEKKPSENWKTYPIQDPDAKEQFFVVAMSPTLAVGAYAREILNIQASADTRGRGVRSQVKDVVAQARASGVRSKEAKDLLDQLEKALVATGGSTTSSAVEPSQNGHAPPPPVSDAPVPPVPPVVDAEPPLAPPPPPEP